MCLLERLGVKKDVSKENGFKKNSRHNDKIERKGELKKIFMKQKDRNPLRGRNRRVKKQIQAVLRRSIM